MEEEYCRLLSVSRNTYYVHKREKRPIIAFLEKYFTDLDLQDFLEFGKIEKMELTNYYYNQFQRLVNNTNEQLRAAQDDNGIKYFDYVLLSHSIFHNEIVELLQTDNFKKKFSELVLEKGFYATPPSGAVWSDKYTTFKILSILDQLNDVEFRYYFERL